MKRYIVFASMLAVLFACGKENSAKVVEKPENLIEEDKMIDVLVDFHLAEEFIKKKGKKLRKEEANFYYYSLFEKHTITQSNFEESIDYYVKLPEQFDAMYADVIEELEKLQTEVNAKPQNTNERKGQIKKNLPEKKNDPKGSGKAK